MSSDSMDSDNWIPPLRVDLDFRKTKFRLSERHISPRFIDQKVTPDVLSFISDCILELPPENNSGFRLRTVWDSDYFQSKLSVTFRKPDAKEQSARSEYDKFIAQQFKTLAYAGVLTEQRKGRGNHYQVQQPEVLNRIAANPFNAWEFLCEYLEATLEASGVLGYFTRYRDSSHRPEDFQSLKSAFIQDMLVRTPINTDVEVRRIFPKVLNPLAVRWQIPGTAHGRVTKYPIRLPDLMYNRPNWRDKGKLPTMTRTQAMMHQHMETKLGTYEMQAAMNAVRRRHQPLSEVQDSYANGEATQVHHIFPQSTHPQLSAVPENLILLTPTQHNAKAHPSNHTSKVDPHYQITCLLAKVNSVKRAEAAGETFYTRRGLLDCINEGLNLELTSDAGFATIELRLRSYENQLYRT